MTNIPRKRPAWRIALFVLGVAAIVIMWSIKGATGQLQGMSPAIMLPMVMVNAAVTLVKVAVMTGAMLLIRWIARKIRK